MTIKLNRIIQLVCVAAAAAVLGMQSGVSISSSVDKSRITIGDLVTYTVRMSCPEGMEVEMPGPAANLGGFEIRDYHIAEPVRIKESIVREASYVISTFVTGEFVIPPLTAYYRSEGDSAAIPISTQEIRIVVESMKASEAGDIRDIKPPEEIPLNLRRIVLLAAGALLGLLLITAGIIVYRRHRSGAPVLPGKVAPPRPPHEVAREALRRLRERDLPAQGKIKEYYIELSEIIRYYIEGRFYLKALEMTTADVLRGLTVTDIGEEDIPCFREFLDACDLVKFAKHIPSDPKNGEIMECAYELIERTRIRAVTEDISEEAEEVTA